MSTRLINGTVDAIDATVTSGPWARRWRWFRAHWALMSAILAVAVLVIILVSVLVSAAGGSTATASPSPATSSTQSPPANPQFNIQSGDSALNLDDYPVPNAYGGYGPLEVADIQIPFTPLRDRKTLVCPVGTHDVTDPLFRKNQRRCVANLNLPDNVDLELVSNQTNPCVDMETYANDKWINGRVYADGTRDSGVWDTVWDRMDYENSKKQWDIARTELYVIWGQDEVQRMVATCVETYAGVSSTLARATVHEKTLLGGVLGAFAGESYAGLMGVFGRMGAHGFVSPFFVSIERKNPVDHTSRLVYLQQGGLLGISPQDVLSPGSSELARHVRDLARVLGRLYADSDAPHALKRVLAIEQALARIHGDTDSEEYTDYIRSAHEFGADVMDFAGFQRTVSASLNIVELYRGIAEGLGWNATASAQLLTALTTTRHWVYKPSFYRALARLVFTTPPADWLLYCKVSVLYDTMQYMPHAYTGALYTGADAAWDLSARFHDIGTLRASVDADKARHLHRMYEKTARAAAPARPEEAAGAARGAWDAQRRYDSDKARHARILAAFREGAEASETDIAREAMEHNRMPTQGFNDVWMKPWHPIRKPLWRTMSSQERRSIPYSLRRPGFIQTIHLTEQDRDLIGSELENTVYADTCAMLAYSMMPEHIERLFVLASLDDRTVAHVGSAMETLRSVIREDIAGADLSGETKQAMLDKVDRVRVRIGSQEMRYWFDPGRVVYEQTRDRDDISLLQLGVAVRTASLSANYALALSTPGPDGDAEHSLFSMPATVANAWHNPQDMTINIPMGILAAPMYNRHYSNTSLAAYLVSICAHELGHMFDMGAGMLFDSHGNLREWVADADVDRLNRRIHCLVRQYSAQSRYGYTQNGMSVISEVMADTYGINWAYKTLLRLGGRTKLPDADVLLFATMFAQIWATRTTAEEDLQRILYDEHAIPEFRIKLTLQNLHAFASQLCGRRVECSLTHDL